MKFRNHRRNIDLSLLYAAIRASLTTQYGASVHRVAHLGPNPMAYSHMGPLTSHLIVKV